MLRAHTTPAWVYLGGFTLTLTAGSINTVGFLGLQHQALSHVTGTVTVLGMELGRAHYGVAFHALAILAAFFLGCVFSGAIISQGRLRLGRRYGVTLSLESLALFTALYFLNHGVSAGDYFAALACGLQNAMVSNYSGSTMRTTHMTGMVTDLGIACSHFSEARRLIGSTFASMGCFSSASLSAELVARSAMNTTVITPYYSPRA
jgi:uncharacterized membrane protein YoaK (UPF0700 family)